MALVVGRKPGEAILIGDQIRVEVIKSDGNSTRLKIDAPKDVSLVREELVKEPK